MNVRTGLFPSHRFFVGALLAYGIVYVTICQAAHADSPDVPRELSVPPSDHEERESPLPDWAVAEPRVVDGVLLLPVRASILTESASTSRELLRIEARGALEAYLEQSLGSSEAAAAAMPNDDWIEQRFDTDKHYLGKVWIGGEEKFDTAALLRLSTEDHQSLARRWEFYLALSRARTLLSAAAGIALLVTVGLACASRVVRRRERLRPTA